MKFEESPMSKNYSYTKKKLSFGNLYFLDKFIVTEIDYGLHLDWSKIQKLIDAVFFHYGKDCKLGYISNKVNDYSYEPNLWVQFFKDYSFLSKCTSVCYSEMNYINGLLEEQFSQKKVKAVRSLEEAFLWVESVDN